MLFHIPMAFYISASGSLSYLPNELASMITQMHPLYKTLPFSLPSLFSFELISNLYKSYENTNDSCILVTNF